MEGVALVVNRKLVVFVRAISLSVTLPLREQISFPQKLPTNSFFDV